MSIDAPVYVAQRRAATVAVLSRIVIADEQPIFRDGLRRLLESQPGLRVVGEARNAIEAAALIATLNPDILLLSLAGSAPFPLYALEQLAAAGRPVRTILLTGAVNT